MIASPGGRRRSAYGRGGDRHRGGARADRRSGRRDHRAGQERRQEGHRRQADAQRQRPAPTRAPAVDPERPRRARRRAGATRPRLSTPYDGISLPVLGRLDRHLGLQRHRRQRRPPASYTCPGDCQPGLRAGRRVRRARRGHRSSPPPTPEAAAKADIAPNAANSYGPTSTGGPPRTSRSWPPRSPSRASRATWCAGRSPPSPAPTATSSRWSSRRPPTQAPRHGPLRLRHRPEAPAVEVMDQITQGIKADTSRGTPGTPGTGV